MRNNQLIGDGVERGFEDKKESRIVPGCVFLYYGAQQFTARGNNRFSFLVSGMTFWCLMDV
jgi:hypothetical protein